MTATEHPSAHGPARHRLRLAHRWHSRSWELHPGVRSDGGSSMAERAADAARDAVGSWAFVLAAVALAGVGMVTALEQDDRAGPAAVLGLLLGGVAVVQLSLVLMAARRSDRIAGDRALHGLESMRRAAAGIHEVRSEIEQLRGDLARLVARVETSSQPQASHGESAR